MPSHDTTLDLMISQLIASLHGARSLDLPAVENAIRDTLITLGRSIASDTPQATPRKAVRKPAYRTTDPERAMDLTHIVDLITPVVRPASSQPIAHAPLPRRRRASRRIGSRG
jgi:hypothetical protein